MDSVVQSLVTFFSEQIPSWMIPFVISLLPILELRGGLIAAAIMNMEVWKAFVICGIGTLLPIPIVLIFIQKILNWMKTTRLSGFANFLERKAIKKSKSVNKYKILGLVIFVAIPLPGTGAWTGALVASFLKIRFKQAFLSIACGTLIADIIMCLLSYSVVGVLR